MSRVTPGPIIQARLHPISGPPPPPPASNNHRSLLQQPMSAVPEPPSHSESFSTTHALTLILTVVLLVLFFVGFFSIYFCRCFMENIISIFNNRGRNPMGTPVNPSNPDPPGLNPNIIETFPAFDYSSVKDYRPESYSLECAICLSEFQEDDTLRLIPDCCHVFHKDCIDLWLASHKSCPVCRRSLDPDPLPDDDGPDSGQGPDPDPNTPDDDIEACGPGDGGSSSYSITVKEEPPWQRFSRSHSTGHSIVRVSGEEERAGAATGEDKYTLRLPEHVIKETITRGHVQTLSCTTFGEMCRGSAQGRSCFGEISGGYNGSCSGDAKQ